MLWEVLSQTVGPVGIVIFPLVQLPRGPPDHGTQSHMLGLSASQTVVRVTFLLSFLFSFGLGFETGSHCVDLTRLELSK